MDSGSGKLGSGIDGCGMVVGFVILAGGVGISDCFCHSTDQ